MLRPVGILAPAYVVGEQAVDVDLIVGKAELLRAYDMPDMKDLWGWGSYCKTSLDHAALAFASASRTLGDSGLAPADIDGLIVCCCDGYNYHAQNGFLGDLSVRLGLGYTFTSWVGGAGCASLFSAIAMAQALVQALTCRHVLIVTVDKIHDDASRLQRFGVLSDAACSLIVTQSTPASYSVLGIQVRSCAASLGNGGKDFQEKCDLIRNVFDGLAAASGFDYASLDAYFGSNVFIPVQELEMTAMPIDGLLAYQDNTARYGHCYAADPLINLVDFYASLAPGAAARSTLMASSAHGHFGLVLLEKN